MEAIDRLLVFQKYVSKQIGGQNKFEVLCGLSIGLLNNASKKKGSVTIRTIERIKEKFPDLNINWIVTGEENMLVSESKQSNIDYKEAYKEAVKAIESLNNVIQIMKGIDMR